MVRLGPTEERCMNAVARASDSEDQLIAVIDGGDPESADRAEALGWRAVRSTRLQGPAGARNEGARAATMPVLAFIDADVLAPTTLADQIRCILRDESIDACFGSYDDLPEAGTLVSDFRNLLHHHVHQREGESYQTSFWSGCGIIRKSAFEAVGGFNDSYGRPCIEDIELGLRLHAEGYRIRLCPALQVKHLKRWTLRTMIETDIFSRAVPWSELILQKRIPVGVLNTSMSDRLSVLSAGAFVAAALIGFIYPATWAAAVMALFIFTFLNNEFLGFLARTRGWLFALPSIGLYMIHFLCAGTGFAIALGKTLSPPKHGKLSEYSIRRHRRRSRGIDRSPAA